MNPFKHPVPKGDTPFSTTSNIDAGMSAIEAELAAIGVDDSGTDSDSKWDGALAVMVLLDDKDDDMDSLKDELDLFRRENDFDLD